VPSSNGEGRKPQKSGRKFTIKSIGVGQRFYKIIVVCFFTLCTSSLAAQIAILKSYSNAHPQQIAGYQMAQKFLVFQHDSSISQLSYFNRNIALPGQTTIRKDHYVQQLRFFCRSEWQFETSTGLPLRLRLGSLAHCNYLEGKR
jgi:hypothetical protein